MGDKSKSLDRMSLGQVPAMVLDKCGVKVSRQTVYNWMIKGRKGSRLRVKKDYNGYSTTERWLDAFIQNTYR